MSLKTKVPKKSSQDVRQAKKKVADTEPYFNIIKQ